MNKLTISDYISHNNNTLENVLKKVRILKEWNNILAQCLESDHNIIEHCHVVDLNKNSLIVIADSPHWVTKLRFKIPEILPKIRTYKGLEKVKAICCKSLPYTQNNREKKPLVEPLKISKKTSNTMIEIAKNIKDQKLKSILEKIASHT